MPEEVKVFFKSYYWSWFDQTWIYKRVWDSLALKGIDAKLERMVSDDWRGGGVKFFGAGYIQVRISPPDFCCFPRPIRIRSPYRTFIELKSNFFSDFLKYRYATYRDQLLKLKKTTTEEWISNNPTFLKS